MIYEMDFEKGQLTPIETASKNALPKGTILQLNGYDNPRYVIVENMGIDEKWGHGAKYLTMNIDKPATGYHDASGLEFLADKTSNMIQMYIIPEMMPEAQVDELYRLALENEAKAKTAADAAGVKRNAALEKGKVWVEANRPPWAKAVIVGYKEIDNCDMQTDYFNTQSGEPYLLAWSKHTKDVFSEMRKAAANLEETKHLATISDVDRNGDHKTAQNESWWHPEDEHREKYSMGAGYYLKAANRYSTGWKVEKWGLDKWRIETIHLAAGEERVRIAQVNDNKQTPVTVEGITITENNDKDGVEIRFPDRPEQTVLDTLRAQGFRWSRFAKCWYRKRTPETLAFAQSLTA